MALTEDQKIEVKGMIYEELPCSTNNTCKEVSGMKKIGWGILILLFATIVSLTLNYLESKDTTERQKESAVFLEKRLDKIDAVMGIK